MQPSVDTGIARFGPFEVNFERRVLRKHGVRVKLQAQPFQILAALLEKPGTTVTRDELRRRLWPDDTFVDFEHGLNAAVARLRQALGDSLEQPRYIETLAKLGYRFAARVKGESERPDPAAYWKRIGGSALPPRKSTGASPIWPDKFCREQWCLLAPPPGDSAWDAKRNWPRWERHSSQQLRATGSSCALPARLESVKARCLKISRSSSAANAPTVISQSESARSALQEARLTCRCSKLSRTWFAVAATRWRGS